MVSILQRKNPKKLIKKSVLKEKDPERYELGRVLYKLGKILYPEEDLHRWIQKPIRSRMYESKIKISKSYPRISPSRLSERIKKKYHFK